MSAFLDTLAAQPWALVLVAGLGSLIVAGLLLIAWELAVAQPAPPDIPCRRCNGHGWTVNAGWAREPYGRCARCSGSGVE